MLTAAALISVQIDAECRCCAYVLYRALISSCNLNFNPIASSSIFKAD